MPPLTGPVAAVELRQCATSGRALPGDLKLVPVNTHSGHLLKLVPRFA